MKTSNANNNEIHIGRYADILMDRWFKRSFGTEPNKRLLQLLLQELIPEREISELTLSPQEAFYERAIFNSSFAVQQQVRRGSLSYDFPSVYFIGIMDMSYAEIS